MRTPLSCSASGVSHGITCRDDHGPPAPGFRRSPGVWPDPPPHPSGAQPPQLPAGAVPQHVAIVMDGNGRWAHGRGLPRTEGHRAGEAALMDVLYGAMQLGVSTISAYAFSTENWRRTPEEVRFLMGFNKDVIRRRRDELAELGVRHPVGRPPAAAVAQRHRPARGRRGVHPRQRPAHPAVLRQLRRPRRDRRRRARDRPRGRRTAGSTRRRSTSAPSTPTSTSPACPTSTCSSAPRASSARPTSCCGSRPTPS